MAAVCTIVDHMKRLHVEPTLLLSALGNGKLLKVIPQMAELICATTTKDELQSVLSTFRGSYAHKNRVADQILANSN